MPNKRKFRPKQEEQEAHISNVSDFEFELEEIDGKVYDQIENQKIKTGILDFIYLFIPDTLAKCCRSMVYVVNVLAAGYLNDKNKLAGLGLANSFHYIFNRILMNSCARPMSTFTSQAFGKGELRLCGIYLNRCRAILTLCAAFTALVLSQS